MNQHEPIFFTPPSGPMRNRRLFKGGDGGTTTTTSNSVPEELKPLASLYTQQATNIASTPFQAYTGQRNADLTPTQNAGIGMVQSRALNGSQTFDNAEANLNQMMDGTSNPYLDRMVQKAQQTTMGNAIGASTRSGSFGNSGIAEATARQMADQANQMYGSQYQFDQGQRMQAINSAPTFANQAYQDGQNLINAGGIQQNQDQQNKDFAYNQFQAAQDHPYKQLQATGSVLQGNMNTDSTQSGGGGK